MNIFQESDDGDEEGREKDYISDSSDRFVIISMVAEKFKKFKKVFL